MLQKKFCKFARRMRQITDINELRQIQMGILDHVHRFCEAHGLTYFLSSGTLIGAVRHKGYIPWEENAAPDLALPLEDHGAERDAEVDMNKKEY